jgi:hypothetical protein
VKFTILNMKVSVLFCVVALILATSGCSWFGHKPAASLPAKTASGDIITPDYSLSAKVISVNTVGRFVVLSFPAGSLPKIDQTMFLYRGGLKVAELRITGPQQDNNIVADITSGDARVGDTVSDKLSIRVFGRFLDQWLDVFGQRFLPVGRMKVEINPAQRPLGVALAQDHGGLPVQRDAVAHSRRAGFVGLDGLVQQRIERCLKLIGSLLHAHHVQVILLQGVGGFTFEIVYGHTAS